MSANSDGSAVLGDGTTFESWERERVWKRTYHVDARAPNASDDNAGSEAAPFCTIGRAAEVLEPGERVLIGTGVYRERIAPRRGGTGPDALIGYEARAGNDVVVKGSVEVSGGWRPSTGWNSGRAADPGMRIWELDLRGEWFGGYNPFGMANVLQDRAWLSHKQIVMTPYFRRRGLVFVDDEPMQQVELFRELSGAAGRFWIEHNGLRVHLRLPDDDEPGNHRVELTTEEQVFSPQVRGLGYILVRGITFAHAGNGFPVPQRGLVSANRGHHFIFEDNTIEWANSIGLDCGNECWNATRPEEGSLGHHVIRRNTIRHCGICGLAAVGAPKLLVEDNLFETCGWQDAEYMYESAGAKFHFAIDMLLRRNVFRGIRHAPALWIDCGNQNCRITQNVFCDISSRAGAIHVEGTHHPNQIDNNVIAGVRPEPWMGDGELVGGDGIYCEGSDFLTVAHNLIMDCTGAGFRAVTVHKRIIEGRGGTAREQRLFGNVFSDCKRSAIEFANPHNESDANVFSRMPGGYLRLGAPDPTELLDLECWRRFHGWEARGLERNVEARLDAASLELTFDLGSETPKVACEPSLGVDFTGAPTERERVRGPFATARGTVSVDPRR